MEEVFQAMITDMNEQGVGVTHAADGQAVFVPGAATGDVCTVRVTERRKKYALGEMVSLLTPSSDRVAEECPVFFRCGGCSLRYVSLKAENRCKRKTVENAFRRTGVGEVPVRDVRFAGNDSEKWFADGYRNKAVLHYDRTEGFFGYYSEKTNTVIRALPCPLLPKLFNRIAQYVNDRIASDDTHVGERGSGQCPMSFVWNEREKKRESGEGKIRPLPWVGLYLRKNAAGEASVIFQLSRRPKNPEERALLTELAEALTREFPAVVGVLLEVGQAYEVLWGEKTLTDRLGGLRFTVSPEGFWQVNHAGAELLCEVVLAYARRAKFDVCVDLYCGAGTFGLILASQIGGGARYYGVEKNRQSIEDAKRNAATNGIGNIEFFCGDAAAFRKKADVRGGLVIMDPPRAGCSDAMLETLAGMEPAHVIYISCDPNTLGRDCAKLAMAGYAVVEATPVNLFPRTKHVETVVQLSKGEIQSKKIRVDFSLEDMDMSGFQKGATYGEIKAYVKEHTGLTVSSLYIAQVKQKCGIIERENYNKPRSENAKQPQCPPEKEAAIRAALEYFKMI